MNTSHTTEFITEMKHKLTEEQQRLVAELQASAKLIDGVWQTDFPEYGEDEESNAMEIERATAQADVVQADAKRLQEVEAALERIATGTYGTTVDGRLIPEDRLRANPAASTLVEQ